MQLIQPWPRYVTLPPPPTLALYVGAGSTVQAVRQEVLAQAAELLAELPAEARPAVTHAVDQLLHGLGQVRMPDGTGAALFMEPALGSRVVVAPLDRPVATALHIGPHRQPDGVDVALRHARVLDSAPTTPTELPRTLAAPELW